MRKLWGGLAGGLVFLVVVSIAGVLAMLANENGLSERLATKIGVALGFLGLAGGYKVFQLVSVPPPSAPPPAPQSPPQDPPATMG